MTSYVDLEGVEPSPAHTRFDILIVGGGAAGLSMVREFAGIGLSVGVIESGALEETNDHEI